MIVALNDRHMIDDSIRIQAFDKSLFQFQQL